MQLGNFPESPERYISYYDFFDNQPNWFYNNYPEISRPLSFIYVKNLKFNDSEITDENFQNYENEISFKKQEIDEEEKFDFIFDRFNNILSNIFRNAIYTDETEDQEYHIKLFKAYKNFEIKAREDKD